jgi:hypothetical protein
MIELIFPHIEPIDTESDVPDVEWWVLNNLRNSFK